MQASFLQRPPSTQWEQLSVPRTPGLNLWIWFRPQHLPGGITIGIPPEVVAAYPAGFPFSVADVMTAAGVEAHLFQAVSLFGAQWQTVTEFAPFINNPVPAIVPGGRPEISILLTDPASSMPAPVAVNAPIANYSAASPAASTGHVEDSKVTSPNQMYDRIESSWKAAVQMERQMAGLRQKLTGLLNSLNKLDRELTPEERLSAGREDRDAWEEARRWVRDLGGKCHREIKQFDIGVTSAAGKRNWMEQQYDQIIEPRLPCGDLENIRREFESYRKDIQNLQRAMTSAVQAASQNGTQRAQRVLAAIGVKIRERRRRMREPVGGTNMDKSCRRKR